MCRLLSRRRSKARFFETCLVGEFYVARQMFGQFSAGVFEGRWGTVARATGSVFLVGHVLRAAWSVDAYKGKSHRQREEEDGDNPHYTNIEKASAAIASLKFWCFAAMIDSVVELIELIMGWGESCPCHWVFTTLQGPKRHDARRKMAQRTKRMKEKRCPLAGMRAPELANGDLMDVIRVGFDVTHADLLASRDMAAAGHSDRTFIITEFSKARKHVVFYMQLKTGCWRQLPWCLLGMADHRQEVARRAAERSLQAYATASPEARDHHLVNLLCSPGLGALQVLQFSRSEDLANLPLLHSYIARMRFVVVVERWIESRHALVKRIFGHAPNASALHLGYRLSWSSIRELLESNRPGILEILGRHCEINRLAAKVLRNR